MLASCSAADLEFHRFPDLFLPGSWPYYDRDVCLFNFWGNETSPATKHTAHIGSGVLFFNSTQRSRLLLNAWAQAMAYCFVYLICELFKQPINPAINQSIN